MGNHVEVTSEKWAFILDSSGNQIFRPAAIYPHLAQSFQTDLGSTLDEWLAQSVPRNRIGFARELAQAAFGGNHSSYPDLAKRG